MSNEAEVSISSAKNIIDNFDYSKYELVKMFRSKDNKFYRIESVDDIRNLNNLKEIFTKDFKNIADIVFPITHGKY